MKFTTNFGLKFSMNISFLLLAFLFFSLSSCENNVITPEARLTQLSDLEVQPGFAWYKDNKAKYNPDPTIVQQIKDAKFNGKVYVFVKPTCSCIGTQQQFPSLMKVLEESNIGPEKCEIYFMSGENDKHPYEGKMHIKDLPSFFVENNGVYFSIIDTLNSKNSSNNSVSIEEVLLEAIK